MNAEFIVEEPKEPRKAGWPEYSYTVDDFPHPLRAHDVMALLSKDIG